MATVVTVTAPRLRWPDRARSADSSVTGTKIATAAEKMLQLLRRRDGHGGDADAVATHRDGLVFREV